MSVSFVVKVLRLNIAAVRVPHYFGFTFFQEIQFISVPHSEVFSWLRKTRELLSKVIDDNYFGYCVTV